jgi:pimeloyl-ACP methyl ester carboxylesterase
MSPGATVAREPVDSGALQRDLVGTGLALHRLPVEQRQLALWHAPPAAGEGATGLLFLHGVTYSSLSVFDLAVPGHHRAEFSALLRAGAAGLHAMSLDLSGYGLSGARSRSPTFADTCGEVAQVLQQVRSLFKVQRLYGVGWSYGAQVMARVAARPGLLDGLVFYGAFWGGGSAGRPQGARVIRVPPGDRRRNTAEHAGGDFSTPAHYAPLVRSRFIERALQVDPTSPVAPLQHYALHEPLFAPQEIDCPVLACHGAADRSACGEDLRAMFAAMPHHHVLHRCFDGADHNVHLGHQRNAFFDTLFDFAIGR